MAVHAPHASNAVRTALLALSITVVVTLGVIGGWGDAPVHPLNTPPSGPSQIASNSGPAPGLPEPGSAQTSPTRVVATIDVGSRPMAAAYDNGTQELFIANAQSNNVSIINDTSNRVVATVAVGSDPISLAYDWAKGEVFVANAGSYNLSVISDSNNSVVASIWLGAYGSPVALTFDNRTSEIFCTIGNTDNVTIISDATNKVNATVAVGRGAGLLAYDWNTREVFVAQGGTQNVSAISDTTNKVAATVQLVGGNPNNLVFDPDTNEVFAVNSLKGGDDVSVVSDTSNKVVATIPVGAVSDGAAYDNRTSQVFVANRASNNTSVISDATNMVVASLGCGTYPSAVAYDAGKGEVFVANYGSNNVTVIADGARGASYRVTFNETGLAPRTKWGVTINGMRHTSSSTSFAVSETNGTYAYIVGTPRGFSPNPPSGSVAVGGTDEDVLVTFILQPTYPVTFTEAGLASGTWWSITLAGATNSSRTTAISFSEANGTAYGFSVGAVPGYSATPPNGTLAVRGAAENRTIQFSQTPSALTLSINSSPSTICTSNSVECPAAVGATLVTLTASAPANGTTPVASGTTSPMFQFIPLGWFRLVPFQPIRVSCLLANGSPSPFCAHNTTVNDTSDTVLTWNWSDLSGHNVMYPGDRWSASFSVFANRSFPNLAPIDACVRLTCIAAGSHDVHGRWTWATYQDSGGSLRMDSFPVTSVFVDSLWTLYPVTFAETGLPSGVGWSVNLSGAGQTSTSPAISFYEPNGTYAYSVGHVWGNAASPRTGSVSVAGAGEPIDLIFTNHGWIVGSALPPTAVLLIDGQPQPVTTGAFNISVVGSTLTTEYRDYNLTEQASGYCTVTKIVRVTPGNITFVPFNLAEGCIASYTLTLTETGLPPGTEWSVRLEKQAPTNEPMGTEHGTGKILFTNLSNGSYAYFASAAGYTPTPNPGAVWLSLPFPFDNETVSFGPAPPPPPTFLGLPVGEGQGVLGGTVTAIVLAVVVVFFWRRSGGPPPATEEEARPVGATPPPPET